MEDFIRNYEGARNFLFSGACTLADMDSEGRTVLYGNSNPNDGYGNLSYAALGVGLLCLAGKLAVDANHKKGLSIPMNLALAGGSIVVGVGLIGYSLVNVISE